MRPMRVLDLDMDFFLSGVCQLAEPGARPAASQAQPWDEARVRAFLEGKCHLSLNHPLPGRIFPTHEGALHLWRERIGQGLLRVPFHLTHIDAHSDLGIGRPGPAYVLECVLAQRPEDRAHLEKYQRERKLDEANYLLFALAFRWISALENVRNPCSRPDMPWQIALKGADGAVNALALSSTLGRLMPQYDFHEPQIPYRAVAADDFDAQAPYDLASLAISPRYAPREADFIAHIFREYIVVV